MLIDLFSDREIEKQMPRLLKQVETRQFALSCSPEKLVEMLNSDNDFCYKMQEIASRPREYKKQYECSYDSHFYLEALGIGTDCREYTIIVDLSDSLDYILHRLTGCPIAKIRAMKNYDRVSRAVLTLDYEKLHDVTLGTFYEIDDAIFEWLQRLLYGLEDVEGLSDREIIDMLLLRFYRTILQETRRVHNYIIMYLRQHHNLVIRSKGISMILGTTDEDIETTCTLLESAAQLDEGYTINLLKLKKFEFFTGGAYHVYSWSNSHR